MAGRTVALSWIGDLLADLSKKTRAWHDLADVTQRCALFSQTHSYGLHGRRP